MNTYQNPVAENEQVKLLWAFGMQADKIIEARRLDIVGFNKTTGKRLILDIPIPSDTNIFQRDNGEGIKVLIFNPLSANFRKWSNTLKQFVGKLPTNCLSAFDHFVGLALEGLRQEIQRIWIKAEVAPIIIGAFGTTTKKLWKTDEGTRYPCFNSVLAEDNSTWHFFLF